MGSYFGTVWKQLGDGTRWSSKESQYYRNTHYTQIYTRTRTHTHNKQKYWGEARCGDISWYRGKVIFQHTGNACSFPVKNEYFNRSFDCKYMLISLFCFRGLFLKKGCLLKYVCPLNIAFIVKLITFFSKHWSSLLFHGECSICQNKDHMNKINSRIQCLTLCFFFSPVARNILI